MKIHDALHIPKTKEDFLFCVFGTKEKRDSFEAQVLIPMFMSMRENHLAYLCEEISKVLDKNIDIQDCQVLPDDFIDELATRLDEVLPEEFEGVKINDIAKGVLLARCFEAYKAKVSLFAVTCVQIFSNIPHGKNLFALAAKSFREDTEALKDRAESEISEKIKQMFK